MDPFTEKLLERTRARRENLQKKMAGRPNAAERSIAKRLREPLADANSVITTTVIAEVPQTSSKPSPSKRMCSAENVKPAEGEKNPMQPTTPVLTDPPTDKKPPIVPACVRPSSSTGVTESPLFSQAQPGELKTVQVESEKTDAAAASKLQTSEVIPVSPAALKSKEDPEEHSSPLAGSMKSRLQRLAEQRKFWDGTDFIAADSAPMSLMRRNVDVKTTSGTTMPSETPVGRRERMATLAATIGTWEDDLSHVNFSKEEPPAKPAAAFGPKSACRDANLAASTKQNTVKPVMTSSTNTKYSSVSNQAAYPSARSSPQKTDTLTTKSTLLSIASPQKTSIQAATVSPVSPSSGPLKNNAVSRGPNFTSSPQKPQLCAKQPMSSSAVPQAKAKAVAPAGVQVKSFLDRFDERCQERTNSPAGGSNQPSTVIQSVTPHKPVQNRLIGAQTLKTTTSDLTQKQKLERESELAQIRSRLQGNNLWKIKNESETKKAADLKKKFDKPVDSNVALFEPKDEPKSHFEAAETPVKAIPPGCGFVVSTPPSTTHPMKAVTPRDDDQIADMTKDEDKNEDIERELNVDQSINSAVINDLFEGILEPCEYQDHEEEDALNISSMSLLTPLAAVVKSPERMMTSTPASSFIVKSNTPDKVCQTSKFQRANTRSSTSDSDVPDEDAKLPYSIDAYRSIRVKESEKPNIELMVKNKQSRAEEPRGSSLFGIKQKLKSFTNDMNLQQTIIHQASQALNCCTDEEHGKGSQVEAEAERLLLVATEKREALKTELQRLKGEGPAGQKKYPFVSEPTSISASKGSIWLQEFRLPLKADFVCSTANKPESMKHSFFIVIRAGAENIVATPLASTHHGLSGDTLTFPTKFTISDVCSEFAIDIEVYCLIQKHELSADKKKKLNKSKVITPKRFLAITKSGQTPVVASPGGPSAVRTSNFVLVGYHKLTLSSIGQNKFPLEKIPFLCPLEGHIYLRMLCEVGSKVEEKGFLTMFEDVSGFGAWHRRWCGLSGYRISYWTYPDDEKRKNPIGCIDLANCTTKRVEPVNREFCARPNTFELVTVRPQREDDKETLVSQCKNTLCVTKNWLSADTKDDRNLWMKTLNQVLMDLRMWHPDGCNKPL
ncbi:anillin isoform X1 [Phycodurus eques]|uniref:anillin isoform X1 n=1 Tax=Phycodurus eques TaxID=693459 RepID=UPI002ACDCC26|nr:anillin isoform X1 [Phycodurus eques]